MLLKRKLIYLAGFLFFLPIALVSYINSSFLETYVGKNYVGLLYVAASLITILSLPKMHKILNRLGNRMTILLFCLLIFLSFIMLGIGNNLFFVLLSFILYFVSVSFVIASLDIFIEDLGKSISVGRLRGFYLMIINSAWIVSQIISGTIITKTSLSSIYIFAAGFMALVMFVFVLFMRDFKDPEYKKISSTKTIKTFIENKNILYIYLSNLILQFFFAWMVIYMPIYLHTYIGFGWDKIGIIFAIMLLPFVLLDFPLGKLSDKIGEKEMLSIGFLIITLSVLIIPLIKAPTLWVWALVLLATRIGAATIEVMSETYFFKKVDKEDDSEISFFRNAPSVAYVIAPLVAMPIIFFVPSLKYLFFFLSAILFLGFLISLRLRDVK